jgi:hypothetical protein
MLLTKWAKESFLQIKTLRAQKWREKGGEARYYITASE